MNRLRSWSTAKFSWTSWPKMRGGSCGQRRPSSAPPTITA